MNENINYDPLEDKDKLQNSVRNSFIDMQNAYNSANTHKVEQVDPFVQYKDGVKNSFIDMQSKINAINNNAGSLSSPVNQANVNNQKVMQGDLGGRPTKNILNNIVNTLSDSYSNIKDSLGNVKTTVNKPIESNNNANNQQMYNYFNSYNQNQQNNGVLSNIQQPTSNIYGSKEFNDMQQVYNSQNANIQNEYLKQALGQQNKETSVGEFFKNMQNEYYNNKEEIKNLLDPSNNQTLDDMIRNTAKIKMLSGANKQILGSALDYHKGVGTLAQQNADKFSQGRIGNMENVSKDIFGKGLQVFSNDNKENFNLQEILYKIKLANDLKKQEETQTETDKFKLAKFINAGPNFINSDLGKKVLESDPKLARGFELYNLQQNENQKILEQKAKTEAYKDFIREEKEKEKALQKHKYDVELEGIKNKNRIEQQKMKNGDYNTEGDSAKQITGV